MRPSEKLALATAAINNFTPVNVSPAYAGTRVYVLTDPDAWLLVEPASFVPKDFLGGAAGAESVDKRAGNTEPDALESHDNIFDLSPDPDQLRVQDLRNIDCYAQPDALEVCGLGDTIPFMLFTKSVAPLQDIRLDVIFEDGIEYGGFAYVDNTLADSGVQLDTISTENPESPSFLLDQVSEATGGVVVYLGVRAECGVDFSINNPDVTLNFSYTNAEGVACTGSVTLEDYGGNVVTPRVVITNTPSFENLGRPGDISCQSLNISQSTMNATATGYIFTAGNYGFDEGISIVEVRKGGDVLPATDYVIDPVTGQLTLVVTSPTADGLLNFNETETIEVCYTYTECFLRRSTRW